VKADQHKRKSEHNENFIDSTFGDFVANPTVFIDWIVTALFYVAVHKVDEYLAVLKHPIHPTGHFDRRRHLRDIADLRVIWKEYRYLEDRSRESRYYSIKFDAKQVRGWQGNRLNKIKTHLDRRITTLTP